MLKLQLIGRLGNEAEIRDAAGKKVISFSVAHSESYTDRAGVKQERTTWVKCAIWKDENRTGVAQYLRKGTQVYVEGTPSLETYVNKGGETVATMKLTVLDIKLLGGDKPEQAAPKAQTNQKAQPKVDYNDTDDLPF